jgi:broad specificity phosphatase PhoE
MDTAREIARHHRGTPLIPMHLLRERDHGSRTGKHKSHPQMDDEETNESMMHRAKRVIDELYAHHPRSSVVVVTHGEMSSAIIGVIVDESMVTVRSELLLDHTSVSIFEILEDKTHTIHLLNCTKHLDER